MDGSKRGYQVPTTVSKREFKINTANKETKYTALSEEMYKVFEVKIILSCH
jgi:hypothetical protein